MITNTSPAPVIFSGVRKAAMLMVILGEKTSAELARCFSEDELQLVSREIARVSQISSEEADAVLDEFQQMMMARDYVMKGGLDYAKKMLITAFGPDHAKKLVDRIIKALGHDIANFDVLHKADPQQLAKFIHSEHPQTIALILSHLSASQAAALLFSLPGELRADVALRMANLDQISPDVINKIAGILGQKLQALGEFSRESYGGVRAVSEMFNRLDSTTSKEILDSIEETDPDLVETIRHMMFVFDDLLLVDINGMKEITSRIDRKILTVALKGTSDQLRDHFLSTLSARASEMLREDMEALGPVKIREVEAAQQQIISLLRQLEADGVINMKGSVGEQYVV
ncbi:flagellar motor switch protein FliG [Nevskia soli]|jgi:flagellar motor switch protein FliG|uniref:flagellar motor switch protein FliG n=1 Tax=Nevskia soli TaxID=418856 RepID=UPI0015D77266|nr:flagellar motor switch protein FliG [Nevskia soli]